MNVNDESLNPLHCGAVVASGHRPEPSDDESCLNPLHCGAVVASRRRRRGRRRPSLVSIPFIAGQWSLPADWPSAEEFAQASQSPSLRGSGRFAKAEERARKEAERVSIPFIAGQWSLPGGTSIP